MDNDNSNNMAYTEIKRLKRKNLRLVMIISEMLSYITDDEILLYLIDKIDKIKSIE